MVSSMVIAYHLAMCLMPVIALASQEVERDRGTHLKGAE